MTLINLTSQTFTFERTNETTLSVAPGALIELDLSDPVVAPRVRHRIRLGQLAPIGGVGVVVPVDVDDDWLVTAASYRVDLSTTDLVGTLSEAPADQQRHEFFLLPGADHTLILDPGDDRQIEQLDGTYDDTLSLTAAGARYTIVYSEEDSRWDLA